MSVRLEKSGELYLIRGQADPPETPKGRDGGLWLALLVFVMGGVFASHLAFGLPVLAHTIKGFLATVW